MADTFCLVLVLVPMGVHHIGGTDCWHLVRLAPFPTGLGVLGRLALYVGGQGGQLVGGEDTGEECPRRCLGWACLRPVGQLASLGESVCDDLGSHLARLYADRLGGCGGLGSAVPLGGHLGLCCHD